MFLDYEPGDYVINPSNKDWGIGQIQSIIKNKVTVNFENVGKKVINSDNIILRKIKNTLQEICMYVYFKFYFTHFCYLPTDLKKCVVTKTQITWNI